MDARNMPDGFGPALQWLRKRRGLRQRDVAESLGYTQHQMSNWENHREPGYLPPEPEITARLARFYQVPESVLIRAAGFMRDAPDSEHLTPDEWMVGVEAEARGMAPDELEAIIQHYAAQHTEMVRRVVIEVLDERFGERDRQIGAG